MKIKDNVGSHGRARIQIFQDGKCIQDGGWQKNGSTNAGLAVISGLAGNTGAQNAFIYLELGTGNTAFSASQTTLISAITDSGLARAAATISRVTTTQTNDTLQLTYTWTASGTKTIAEVGVFNAASSGVMGYRQVPASTLSAVSGNQIMITYQIKYS